MARRTIKEWQSEFLKLYAEAQKDLGVDSLQVEMWSERVALVGYGKAEPKKTKNYCEITIK